MNTGKSLRMSKRIWSLLKSNLTAKRSCNLLSRLKSWNKLKSKWETSLNRKLKGKNLTDLDPISQTLRISLLSLREISSNRLLSLSKALILSRRPRTNISTIFQAQSQVVSSEPANPWILLITLSLELREVKSKHCLSPHQKAQSQIWKDWSKRGRSWCLLAATPRMIHWSRKSIAKSNQCN